MGSDGRGRFGWVAATRSYPRHPPRSQDNPQAAVVPRLVTAVHRLFAGIVTLRVGGQTIETTAEHPVFVAGVGWRRVRQLQPGDLLAGADGELTAVEAVDATERAAPVFNLRVEADHTYFVGDTDWGFSIWVHNAYSARQAADGTWELVDEAGNVARKGIKTQLEAESAARFHNKKRFDEKTGKWKDGEGWKAILEKYEKQYGGDALGRSYPGPVSGNPQKGTHAHHILQKGDMSPDAVWCRETLYDYGIDPLYGREGLIWAPNNHHSPLDASDLKKLMLEALEDGGTQEQIREKLCEALREAGRAFLKKNGA